MFRAPAYWHNNSLKLATVLEDIGVNERMVLKRRRCWLLMETMITTTLNLTGINTCYYLGSQSEGTTTHGLDSDLDLLYCLNNVNVIQMWEEWKPGANNLMMIQDENTTPGYCFLQQLYCDEPLPVTVNEARYEDHAIYKRDKVILKNTMFNSIKLEEQTREGAAFTVSNILGYTVIDQVFAFPCKSFLRSVSAWLYKQAQTGNISNQMKIYIESNPCLVVQTGCKGSPYEKYEWRISTSFIERCLMFNLNVTQIQCYVMMKLILKTYLDHPNGKLLSSFVCKNILLFSIKLISPAVWIPHNLLHVFTFCLLKLKHCVLSGECPHFIIHGNNLLRRKLNSESKLWLVERIDFVIQSYGRAFLCVKIDDIDSRLMSKFNIIRETLTILDTPEFISMTISGSLIFNTAVEIGMRNKVFLGAVMSGESDLSNILRTLTKIYSRGCKLDQTACRLLSPSLCSTLGCIKASEDIHRGIDVSFEAMDWLSVGLNSDVASSRLKLASVLYCVGDINCVETMLRPIEQRYQLDIVKAVCKCYDAPGEHTVSQQFLECASTHNEYAIQHIVAFCVVFLSSEINCIPHELRYEMFRSTPEDMQHRREYDFWMNWAVIDSLPYLYFLQYKTYSRLRRYEDQQRALTNLSNSIFTTENLGHKETALNLLGQCLEQEDRPQDALHCYMMSLRVRSMNNVAKIHICRLLSSLLRT